MVEVVVKVLLLLRLVWCVMVMIIMLWLMVVALLFRGGPLTDGRR